MRQVNGWGFRRIQKGIDRHTFYHAVRLPSFCSNQNIWLHMTWFLTHCVFLILFSNLWGRCHICVLKWRDQRKKKPYQDKVLIALLDRTCMTLPWVL